MVRPTQTARVGNRAGELRRRRRAWSAPPLDWRATGPREGRSGEVRQPAQWRKLIKMLLDPNPGTRIAVPSLLETLWFRKTAPVPRPIIADPAPAPVDTRGNAGDDKDEPPEVLNAFHLISLSEGFDLSPLFEHDSATSPGRATARAGGTRFTAREAASGVVARLEALATGGATPTRAECSSPWRPMSLAWRRCCSCLVVDVKKDGSDAMDYRSLCSEELRPALKDIVW
uniref:non-specific serine/threonine protein kinase n=1 Tax=Oryza sativa subsp. japonica TaxID=39947 RepID=Q7XQW1_ORYSJ|nr:OSJNBb0050N09.8 [Oryza sativa Japonica Group]